MENLARAFRSFSGSEDDKDSKNESNELWVMLDATDSGLSIDNIIDLKFVLNRALQDNSTGKDIYIIISCNEYEMCVGEKCFDVQKMRYVSIKSYDKFRKVILESREYKDSLYKNGDS